MTEFHICLNAKRDADEATSERERLILTHTPLVLWCVKRMYRGQAIPDDAIQVGMLALTKSADLFDESLGFKFTTYAYAAITRSVLSWRRDRKQQPLERSPDCVEAVDDVSCPPGDAIQSEEAAALHEVLGFMEERERTVLEMLFFRGYTLLEIGKLWGVSKARAGQIKKKALATAARLIEELPKLKEQKRISDYVESKFAQAREVPRRRRPQKVKWRESKHGTYWRRLRRAGLCTVCGKVADGSQRYCKICLEKRRRFTTRSRLVRSHPNFVKAMERDAIDFLRNLGYRVLPPADQKSA